jgi:hypothetical protein
MYDCANVEMRELLPGLVAGTADAATRARVEDHVASCAECASELETLRLVRSAYATAPSVDVRRVLAALPKPPGVLAHARRATPVKRWADRGVAAALTTITAGALSLAVSQRSSTRVDDSRPDTAITVMPVTPGLERVAAIPQRAPRRVDSGDAHTAARESAANPRAKAQLSFGGGMSDLDDASIQQLLGVLDEIDHAPVAPSAEPDRSPVLPVIKGADQ